MKPAAFDYSAPASKDGILRALAGAPAGTRILAGGQSLVPLMNARQMRPPVIVDINSAPELGRITVEDGVLRIGALVRMSQAESSPEVRACCPLITEALRWVANPQVRNRATIVGNLAHAARGSEMPAVAVALDAELTVESDGGRLRTIPAREFFRPEGGTACGPGEFVTAVSFPCQPAGCGSAFVEAQRRSSHYALLGAAAVLLIRSGTIREARLSFAGAAPVPIRCLSAERTLVGAPVSPEILMNAAALAGRDGTTLAYDDLHATSDYRRLVAPELAARALFSAARSAGSDLQQPHWS
jgi:carbon-monoxide dehydrogenase medium subunit